MFTVYEAALSLKADFWTHFGFKVKQGIDVTNNFSVSFFTIKKADRDRAFRVHTLF